MFITTKIIYFFLQIHLMLEHYKTYVQFGKKGTFKKGVSGFQIHNYLHRHLLE